MTQEAQSFENTVSQHKPCQAVSPQNWVALQLSGESTFLTTSSSHHSLSTEQEPSWGPTSRRSSNSAPRRGSRDLGLLITDKQRAGCPPGPRWTLVRTKHRHLLPGTGGSCEGEGAGKQPRAPPLIP